MLSTIKSPIVASMPNSSRSSRIKHCSGLSPASVLPPGNSHLPAKCLPAFLLAMRNFPLRSITAAVTPMVLIWFVQRSGTSLIEIQVKEKGRSWDVALLQIVICDTDTKVFDRMRHLHKGFAGQFLDKTQKCSD